MPEKRKRDRKTREQKRRKIGKKYQDLDVVAFPSSSIHGIAGLDSIHHYARTPAKIHEAGVYGGDRAQGLPCAVGSYVPCT
jgi:hypothetical protein